MDFEADIQNNGFRIASLGQIVAANRYFLLQEEPTKYGNHFNI
ncbi:15630_t:CDS:1, partial [Cetraspora pellucida]